MDRIQIVQKVVKMRTSFEEAIGKIFSKTV